MKNLSVLLIEDSALFCSALDNVFSQNKTFSLDVCSSRSFLRRMAKINYDAVVIDAVTWAAGLQALVGAVQRAAIVTPVILLGRDDLLDTYLEALRAGAAGFIKQTASPKVLLKAVRAVATGDVYFERKLFRKVFIQSPLPDVRPRAIQLTQKEEQILNLVVSGNTNKEIGANLGFGERTVKAYVSNLFRKTGVANRSGLTSYAITHGLTRITLDQMS